MPSETELSEEEKKKREKEKKKQSLAGQTSGLAPSPSPKPSPKGLDSATAFDRTRGAWTEGGKRAQAEADVTEALVTEKVQMNVDTPDKRADAWLKANGKVLGIGNRGAYFKKIKEGLSPEEAWKAVGGK